MGNGKMLAVSALFLCALFGGVAYAATLTLQPGAEGKDAYISSGGLSEGDGPRLISGFQNAEAFWTLIEFNMNNLTNITNTTNITSAVLWLYCNQTNGSNNYSVYQADGDWNEDMVTWVTRPAIGDYYDTETIMQYGFGWHSWSVTQHVADVVSGAIENNGVIVKTPYTTGIASFHSSDYATSPLLRPKLVITYNN